MCQYNFKEYQEKVKRVITHNASLEKDFQGIVIRPFLEKLFIGKETITVEDTSVKPRHTDVHDLCQYCEKRPYDKNKKGYRFMASPDLIVADNYYHHNIAHDVSYLAAIEIKSPFGDGRVHDGIKANTMKQVNSYFSSTKISKVILTDCLVWYFYEKDSQNNPVKDFRLIEKVDKVGEEDVVVWADQSKWDELQGYVVEFCKP